MFLRREKKIAPCRDSNPQSSRYTDVLRMKLNVTLKPVTKE
jgi:hypothetical protein